MKQKAKKNICEYCKYINSPFCERCRALKISLKEHHLNGRLQAVLLNPTINIKKELRKKDKRSLVSDSVLYLLKNLPGVRAIIWQNLKKIIEL